MINKLIVTLTFQMNFVVLGLFAIVAVASGYVVPLYSSHSALVRTPSLDSAVVQSDSHNGAFSYSTVENHAYAPVLHSVRFSLERAKLCADT